MLGIKQYLTGILILFSLQLNAQNLILQTEDLQDDQINILGEDFVLDEMPIHDGLIIPNSDGVLELLQRRIISDLQFQALQSYLSETNELLSEYELFQIKEFTLSDIYRLRSYLKWENNSSTISSRSKSEILFRTSFRNQTLTPSAYFRIKIHKKKTQFGFGADKDIDETFAISDKAFLFDHYSAYLKLQPKMKYFEEFILGDYHINFGQGLQLYTGFNIGALAEPLSMYRTKSISTPYSSSSERNYLRGLIGHFRFHEFQAYPFVSFTAIDGKWDDEENMVKEINLSAYHISENSLASKNNTTEFISGLAIKHSGQHGSVSWLTSYQNRQIKQSISRSDLFQNSLAYQSHKGNIIHSGEINMKVNALSFTHSSIFKASLKDELILHLYKIRNSHLGAYERVDRLMSSGDEQGVGLGIKRVLYKRWAIASEYLIAQGDPNKLNSNFRNYQMKFRINLSTNGKYEGLKLRFSRIARNQTINSGKLKSFFIKTSNVLMADYYYRWSNLYEIKAGLKTDPCEGMKQMLCYFEMKTKKASDYLVLRFSLFNNSSSSPFYSIQRDVLYYFSTNAYHGSGSEFFALTKIKLAKKINVWLKFAHKLVGQKKSWTLRAQLILKLD